MSRADEFYRVGMAHLENADHYLLEAIRIFEADAGTSIDRVVHLKNIRVSLFDARVEFTSGGPSRAIGEQNAPKDFRHKNPLERLCDTLQREIDKDKDRQ